MFISTFAMDPVAIWQTIQITNVLDQPIFPVLLGSEHSE